MRAILAKIGYAVGGLVAGAALVGTLLLILLDRRRFPQTPKWPDEKIDKEAKDAHDAEAARVAALPAAAVVAGLPDAGAGVGAAIAAGKRRAASLFQRSGVGLPPGGG